MRSDTKAISAAEFDEKFDNGEDVSAFVDLKNIQVNKGIQRINIDIPKNILKQIDLEAARVGVARTALIKVWLSERLELQKQR